MRAARARRAILGTALAGGLGLVGLGTAGVLALDGDLQAAERPQVRVVRERSTTPGTACPRQRGPQGPATRHAKV